MPARDYVLEQEILSNRRRLREGLRYAKVVLRRRWTEWEEEVLRQLVRRPVLLPVCVKYAVQVIKGIWPELEAVFFQLAVANPMHKPILFCSADRAYAEYTIDPLAEDIVVYARDVIKGRWTEFESQILNGKCRLVIAVAYTAKIRGAPWPALEKLLKDAAPKDAMEAFAWYASDVHKRRWRPAETYFLNHPSEESLPYALYYYARHAVKGRLPERLHGLMMMQPARVDPDNNWARTYLAFLAKLQP